MIPLAVLAVFAFNAAQAQIYGNNYDAPVFAATHLGASTPGGGNIAFGDGCGGTNGYSMNPGPFSVTYTFTIDPGYKVDLSSINLTVLDWAGTNDATVDNLQILVNGSNYGAAQNSAFNTTCLAVNRNVVLNNLTGSFTVTFSGTSSASVAIDDIQMNGAISCISPVALAVTGTSSCPAGTGTVSVASPTSASVNYRLYKNNVATGTNLNGNGAGITFTGLTGGVYTVKGFNNFDNACVTDMTGSFTVAMAPQVFTVSGGGNICANPAGGSVPVMLSGSEVGVTYQLKNNGTNVGPAMAGNGSALTWSVTAASSGTNYTVDVVASPSVCAQSMTGSAVVTVSQPTAAFTGNNGEFCSGGGNGVFTITGTPNAIIDFTVTGGAPGTPYVGQVNILPNGTATITVNGITANTVVILTQATNTTGTSNCTQNLTGASATSTLVVRPALVMTINSSDVTICSGGSLGTFSYSVNGTAYARTIFFRNNGVPGSTNLGIGVGSGTITPNFSNTNAGPANATYQICIDSVRYNTAPTCVSTTGNGCRTYTVRANPTFSFLMNGVTLTPNSSDTICIPVGTVTFSLANIVNGVPGSYTILKDNVNLGSGNITSGTVSLIPQVNFNPAGNYQVTLTGPNCSTTLNFTVVTSTKPSFTYVIAGQNVTQGATIQVCAASSSVATLTSGVGNSYSATGFGAAQANPQSPINAGGVDTWTVPASAVGTYTSSITVNTNPLITGGCDSTITFTVVVNPNPAASAIVAVNGGTPLVFANSAAANEREICENIPGNTITVTGAPGTLLEMFTNYGRSYTTNTAGSTVVPTQVGTYIIPSSGVFTYTFNSGPYDGNTDGSSAATSSRNYYRIEVKNPTTLCASTIDFRLYIKQKPRVDVGWTISGASAPGTLINQGDTIKICYPAQVRFYFNRGTSNDADLNATLTYVFKKDATTAATGTITTSPVSYYEFPVNQGATGTYTLTTTSSNGCDSTRTFYVKAYSSPKFTFSQGATVNPTAINFCEGYAATMPISIVSDSVALTQTFTLVRTGGTGTVTGSVYPASGTLTGTPFTHIFSTLGANGNLVGTHNFTLTVTAAGNACTAVRTFTVNVTPMPKPVLTANSVVMVNGSTYTYCEEEVVEYRIAGVPNGSTYTLTRTNPSTPLPVQVATGTTIQAEQSVITFMMASNTAGLYTLKVTNSGSSTCDSMMSFTVNVNDRPDITIVSTTNVSVCNGSNNGSVTYSYVASGVGANNTISRKLYRNNLLVSDQDNTILSGTITNPNLLAGSYMLVVANASCSDTVTFTIGQPATAVVLTVTNTGAACNSNNGTATLSFSGGTGPYFLQIFDPTMLPVSTQTNVAATNNWNINNLAPGTYTVQLTDALGCMKTATFTINSCTAPDLFPFATVNPANYSLANTPSAAFQLQIYNSGQSTTTGSITATITLPSGFALSGTNAGWTLTQLGMSSIYMVTTNTVNILPGIGTPATLNFQITDPGTPGTGFYAIVSSISGGSGGEINTGNNSAITLFNVNP
ncbi:MAG: hypothetical protein EOP51_14415 [Sphingobacteriales bacterium]|nr:MAG: hypothetical protein EOP51_14415 [Sphingobacteriales bacterium]